MSPELTDLAAYGEERLRARSVVTDRGCWEWGGFRDPLGYGRTKVRRRSELAHRVAFAARFGDFDRALIVRHRCDNPSCCNPDHLALGTHADNSSDRDSRGRGARGERQGRAKLDDSSVLDIRHLYEAGWPVADIADAFGVAPRTVRGIVYGTSWRHLPCERPSPAVVAKIAAGEAA